MEHSAIGLPQVHVGTRPQSRCGHGRAQEVDEGGAVYGRPLAEAAFQRSGTTHGFGRQTAPSAATLAAAPGSARLSSAT
ncbi:hypothetical protein SAMN04489729_7935 [Amycolatopsis lurida]|nr:hypothetical protein SAMN04489729_7935 [Amycolatopsis lurida]